MPVRALALDTVPELGESEGSVTSGDVAESGESESPDDVEDAENAEDPEGTEDAEDPEDLAPGETGDSSAIAVIDYYAVSHEGKAFAVGTDKESLLAVLDTSFRASFDPDWSDQDALCEVELRWDLSSVNVDVLGVYTVVPEIVLPQGVSWGINVPDITYTFVITELNSPSFDMWCTSWTGQSYYPWLVDDDFLQNVSIQFGLEGEVLQSFEDYGYAAKDALYLYSDTLESGKGYVLQVTFPDGTQWELSFVCDGSTMLVVSIVGGDRDGGDGNGFGSVVGVQPAPVPDAGENELDDATSNGPANSTIGNEAGGSNSTIDNEAGNSNSTIGGVGNSNSTIGNGAGGSNVTVENGLTDATTNNGVGDTNSLQGEASGVEGDIAQDSGDDASRAPVVEDTNVMESYGETSITLSGRRMNDLATQRDFVLFDFGDATASVASEDILALNLADTSLFTVQRSSDSADASALALVDGSTTDIPVTTEATETSPQPTEVVGPSLPIIGAIFLAVVAMAMVTAFALARRKSETRLGSSAE